MSDDSVAGAMRIMTEIANERRRQDEKWGEQNHPSIHTPPSDGNHLRDQKRVADHYGIPSPDVLKHRCEVAEAHKCLTWGDILLEEVSEAIAEHPNDEVARRAELVQVAAVAIAWIQAIDRRLAK